MNQLEFAEGVWNDLNAIRDAHFDSPPSPPAVYLLTGINWFRVQGEQAPPPTIATATNPVDPSRASGHHRALPGASLGGVGPSEQ